MSVVFVSARDGSNEDQTERFRWGAAVMGLQERRLSKGIPWESFWITQNMTLKVVNLCVYDNKQNKTFLKNLCLELMKEVCDPYI